MKIKKSNSDEKIGKMSLSGSSVFNRLGSSWSENKMDRSSSRVSKRESPRKKVKKDDLRKKIQKTFNDEEPSRRQDGEDERVNFKAPEKYETDEVTLKRREKQISYGKNTIAYDKYIALVPKSERSDTDPRTPQKHKKFSRRQWEGIVKKWKQNIHSTVQALEMEAETEERMGDAGCSIESWVDDVEEEEERRSRAFSMTSSSSDQGLGNSICSSSSDIADGGDVF